MELLARLAIAAGVEGRGVPEALERRPGRVGVRGFVGIERFDCEAHARYQRARVARRA